MFVATMSIAISLSMTCVYLVLYPTTVQNKKLLNSLDYMGKLIMVFGFSFAAIGSELYDSSLYFPFLFILVVSLITNLVFLQFPIGFRVTLWLTIVVISSAYVYDFAVNSTPKQKRVFYIPMFVEGIFIGIGYLMYRFEFPERFCKNTRFIQLYMTGYIFYTLIFINVIFEAHNILYYTIKLNAGTYDDFDDDWWRISPIFNKT